MTNLVLALNLALALVHPASLSRNAAKTLEASAPIMGRDLKNFSALEN